MSAQEKLDKSKIFILVSIVEIIVVLAFLSYKGLLLTTKSRELSLKTQELEKLSQTASTIEILKNNIKESNKKLEGLKGNFFNDDTLLNFLKQICDNAKSYGIDVNTINFGSLNVSVDGTPPIKVLPVGMSLTGSYSNLVKFLEFLEKNKEHIEEMSVSISGSNSISLNIKFYVLTNSSDRWVYERSVP